MNNPELIIMFLMMFLMFGRFLIPIKLFCIPLVYRLIIPGLLLFLWICLMFYQSFSIESVFTVLTDSYNSTNLNITPQREIIARHPVVGKFTASRDYLGIVGIRFWNFYRLNDDYLTFRIKQQGSDKWYYENIYKTDQFQPHQYFTFGFPVIVNSQNHQYEFQIESSSGITGNAVGISPVEPAYIVKYKYPKDKVTAGIVNFIKFCGIKIENLIKNSTFTASSYVFLLPLLIYLVFISRLRSIFLSRVKGLRYLISKKNISILLSIVGLLADILFIRINLLSIWILLAIIIYVILTYKLKSNTLFYLSLFTLLLSGILLYIPLPVSSERSGAWAWILLFIWTIWQIWLLKRKSQ